MKNRPLIFVHIGIVLALLHYGGEIILPLLFAFFLFLLLDPLVEAGVGRGVSRKISAPILVSLAMLLVCAMGIISYNYLVKIVARVPTYSEKILKMGETIRGKASVLQKSKELFLVQPLSNDDRNIQRVEVIESNRNPPFSGYLLHGMNSVLSLASILFFIPLISFFMLLERDYLAERIRKLFNDDDIFDRSWDEIRMVSRGFFIGNFILASVMTALFAAVFLYLNLENALGFALFSGILNLIPVFGAILGGILPALQAGLQFDGLGNALVVIISSIAIHFVGNNLILPRVMGARMNVNGTAAVIGFLFWGMLWGAMGLFLAIPLMSILRILLLASNQSRRYARLIADRSTI